MGAQMREGFKRKLRSIITTELRSGTNEVELHAWLLGFTVAWAYKLGWTTERIVEALHEYEKNQPKRETHASDS